MAPPKSPGQQLTNQGAVGENNLTNKSTEAFTFQLKQNEVLTPIQFTQIKERAKQISVKLCCWRKITFVFYPTKPNLSLFVLSYLVSGIRIFKNATYELLECDGGGGSGGVGINMA